MPHRGKMSVEKTNKTIRAVGTKQYWDKQNGFKSER